MKPKFKTGMKYKIPEPALTKEKKERLRQMYGAGIGARQKAIRAESPSAKIGPIEMMFSEIDARLNAFQLFIKQDIPRASVREVKRELLNAAASLKALGPQARRYLAIAYVNLFGVSLSTRQLEQISKRANDPSWTVKISFNAIQARPDKCPGLDLEEITLQKMIDRIQKACDAAEELPRRRATHSTPFIDRFFIREMAEIFERYIGARATAAREGRFSIFLGEITGINKKENPIYTERNIGAALKGSLSEYPPELFDILEQKEEDSITLFNPQWGLTSKAEPKTKKKTKKRTRPRRGKV